MTKREADLARQRADVERAIAEEEAAFAAELAEEARRNRMEGYEPAPVRPFHVAGADADFGKMNHPR